MMFGHEHHHDVAIHVPTGPTPVWCKVCFAAAVVAVITVLGHSFMWGLW